MKLLSKSLKQSGDSYLLKICILIQSLNKLTCYTCENNLKAAASYRNNNSTKHLHRNINAPKTQADVMEN